MTATPPDAVPTREVGLMVPRSARYVAAGGDGSRAPAELWIVLHGYAQLARRFVRPFLPLASPARLVVAPEALSRFYVEAPGRAHADARVGAAWMTREDRDREIEDQRRYLDLVVEDALAPWPGAAPRLVVLGFSQGVATMARWADTAARPIDRLIAWGGTFPAELDAPTARRTLAGRLTIVGGRADALMPPARLEEEIARLATLGVEAPVVWYDGGHAIDGATLVALAAG